MFKGATTLVDSERTDTAALAAWAKAPSIDLCKGTMLQSLCLGPSQAVQSLQLVPQRLQPLVAAANRGDDVAPIVDAIAKSFGFDGFMYGVSVSPHPNQESRIYVYLTWPKDLPRIYDEHALFEIDPRVQSVLESVIPMVWDQTTFRGRSVEVDQFLDVMKQFGIASGIVCPIRDMRGRTAMLSLSSHLPANDDVRTSMIAQELGDVMLFGHYFHELFLGGVLSDRVSPYLQGGKLSARERQCLTMAAHGLAGEDIAFKLSISLRTVQHHFDSIRSKLGAANRMEAVALGLETGIIAR